MQMRILSSILLLLVFFSCKERKQGIVDKQKEIEAGKLDSSNIYTVKEIGWTTILPEGWKIITREEVKRITEKGKKEMEKTFQTEIDVSDIIELVSIKKDRFNSLYSNMQKFEPDFEIPYDDRVIANNELLRTALDSKGMKFEDRVRATRIKGIMFDILELDIYAPGNDKKVILYQSMYSALINGYDFCIIMTYNTEASRDTLMNVINNSKFSIR